MDQALAGEQLGLPRDRGVNQWFRVELGRAFPGELEEGDASRGTGVLVQVFMTFVLCMYVDLVVM